MNVNSWVDGVKIIVTKEMANEKLGVSTKLSPGSLQLRGFTFVQWGLTC